MHSRMVLKKIRIKTLTRHSGYAVPLDPHWPMIPTGTQIGRGTAVEYLKENRRDAAR